MVRRAAPAMIGVSAEISRFTGFFLLNYIYPDCTNLIAGSPMYVLIYDRTNMTYT